MTSLRHNRPMAAQRGFTLLEFIIYIALVTVVLGAAVMFALQFTVTQTKASVTAQATRNAQFAMERIRTEVREADAIDIGATTFGSDPDTLTLTMADAGTDPTVFAVTDGQLTVQQGTDPPLPLTEPGVEVVEFTLEDLVPHGRSQYIRVHLKVSLPASSGFQDIRADVELDATVHVRNHEGFSLNDDAYAA